jgi:hypothetical protein
VRTTSYSYAYVRLSVHAEDDLHHRPGCFVVAAGRSVRQSAPTEHERADPAGDRGLPEAKRGTAAQSGSIVTQYTSGGHDRPIDDAAFADRVTLRRPSETILPPPLPIAWVT